MTRYTTFGQFSRISNPPKLSMDIFFVVTNLQGPLGEYNLNIPRWWYMGLLSGSESPKIAQNDLICHFSGT